MSGKNYEEVILVDAHNKPLGLALKQAVHQSLTPLHRAFSIFLFNPRGDLLIQQRSQHKRTWPLVWSNSCCGHPAYGEGWESAVSRRLQAELGIKAQNIEKIANYQYKFVRGGVMENEVCPIFVGVSKENPHPNKEEVENYDWLSWLEFLKIKNTSEKEQYSEWSLEEADILENSPKFKIFYQNLPNYV